MYLQPSESIYIVNAQPYSPDVCCPHLLATAHRSLCGELRREEAKEAPYGVCGPR